MQRTMKAAVVHPSRATPGNRRGPRSQRPARGQVLVKIAASGRLPHRPARGQTATGRSSPRCRSSPGHEGVGYVAAVGTGVKRSRKETASACPGYTAHADTASTASPAGRRSATEQQNTGYSVNGGYAEYVARGSGLRGTPAGASSASRRSRRSCALA